MYCFHYTCILLENQHWPNAWRRGWPQPHRPARCPLGQPTPGSAHSARDSFWSFSVDSQILTGMKEKTVSFTHRSSFPVTSGLWRARSWGQSRPTAARAAGRRRACETGPGAEHPRLRAALPPGPGRAGGRAAGSAARKDGVCLSRDRGAAGAAAPRRCPPQPGAGGGSRHGGGRPRHPPGSARGAAQVGGWVAPLGLGPAARGHGRNGAAEARRHLSRGGRAVCRRAGEVGGQVGRSVSKPLAWGVRGFWLAILIRLHTDSVTLAFCVAPGAPSPQPRWPGRALISPPASGRRRRPPSAAGPGAGHRPLLPLLRQTRRPAAQASLLPPARCPCGRRGVINSSFLLAFLVCSEFWGYCLSSCPFGYKRTARAIPWNGVGLALRWYDCGTCQCMLFPHGVALGVWK